MQKAPLYEAMFLVNHGIDETVRGLERLKRVKELSPETFDATLLVFEEHRALTNGYFCNTVEDWENQDAARFHQRYREYQIKELDELKVYEDVRAVEARRQDEGEPPLVRFLTEEEQQEWRHEHPKPPEHCEDEAAE